MIYFRNFNLDEEIDKLQFENAIRRYSSKRTDFLDFKSSTSDFGLSMYFLGHERKKDIQFTRIRTSFERVLPKLIFSLPKSEEFNYYKVRLSLTATACFCLLSFMILYCTILVISNNSNYVLIPSTVAVLCVYVLLIRIEVKLTNSRIRKAIKNYTVS